MPVSDTHKLYSAMVSRIEIVRDCVAGSDAIKSRKSTQTSNRNNSSTGIHNVAGSRYLPPPNPSDSGDENIDRYQAYKERANFVNFTASTKEGFMGMIDRKKPEVELVSGIDFMVDNSDGSGVSLNQLIKKTICEILEAGSYGLLSDFPISEKGLTKAQTQDLRAVIKTYPRESVINWKETVINGITMLSQVVLREVIEEIDLDGFGVEEKIYHRVLFLDDGVYKQNIYDEDDKLIFHVTAEGEPESDIIPTKADGSTWNIIPFEFAGAEINDPIPQKPVLYDLAEINVSHYRNSADYEESSFMVGQPTLVVAGLTQTWLDENFKEGIMVGSRAGLPLPTDASAELLQADPNQMPSKGMEFKEEQMVKIGAKIIVDNGGVETAEAAKIRFAGQNSKLGTVVSNTEEAILKVLGWTMEFMGIDGDNSVEINRQFYEATINPQLIIANMQLLDRKVIGVSDVRNGLRKANVIAPDRTDEQIDEEIEGINPTI